MISDDQSRPVADKPKPAPPERPTEYDPARTSKAQTQFIELFDAEFHGALAVLFRCGASLHDAQDAVHEAFIEAWKLMAFRPEKWAAVSNRRAWIRAVALNKYRQPNGSRLRVIAEPRAELPEPASRDGLELSPVAQDLLDALGRLPEPMRSIMALSSEDGITAVEIGKILGLSDQKVVYLRKKARKILARDLAEMRRQEVRWTA